LEFPPGTGKPFWLNEIEKNAGAQTKEMPKPFKI